MSSDTPLSRWLRTVMPIHGYPLEGPRAGGISRLADDAGIPQATMSRLVHGRGEPTTANLRKLGRIFGKDLGEMMVIAELAEPGEVGTRERRPAFDVIANENVDVSIEEVLGGLRDEYERRIASATRAPIEKRLKLILMYRQIVETIDNNNTTEKHA